MDSPTRRLINPITRCWAKPHNRDAGTDDDPAGEPRYARRAGLGSATHPGPPLPKTLCNRLNHAIRVGQTGVDGPGGTPVARVWSFGAGGGRYPRVAACRDSHCAERRSVTCYRLKPMEPSCAGQLAQPLTRPSRPGRADPVACGALTRGGGRRRTPATRSSGRPPTVRRRRDRSTSQRGCCRPASLR
jgi:hypothetical protein